MEKNKNPFANTDGSPIDGKEPEFFEWEKENSKSELKKLPEEIQAEIIDSERELNKRMDS